MASVNKLLPDSASSPVSHESRRRITVKDVALRAGVQHASVSVVLNGAKSNTHVSEASRSRIMEAARELGYRRNGSMGAARSGRFNAVGLLLSTTQSRSSVPADLWKGMLEALSAEDLHLIVQELPDTRLTDESFVPKILREWTCDGLLIDYTDNIPAKFQELVWDTRTPAIWINTKLPADCIYPDDFGAGERAANYLLSLGHERIAYCCQHLNLNTEKSGDLLPHYSVFDRRDGAQAALNGVGQQLETLSPDGGPVYGERLIRWAHRFRAVLRPTAVIAYSGYDTDLVLHAAETAGLRVPDDLSVITFGGVNHEMRGQRTTTLIVPEAQLGRVAVSYLLQKITAPENPLPPLSLPFDIDLKAGQTCAPPTG